MAGLRSTLHGHGPLLADYEAIERGRVSCGALSEG